MSLDGRGGRGRDADRLQRRRQVDDAAAIAGLTPGQRGHDRVRRRGHHPRARARDRRPRHRALARGPPLLPAHDRAREPRSRRLPAPQGEIAEPIWSACSSCSRASRSASSQKAGTMSGGEQQMLAIGRALMARPRLLMLDEPSMGIAPILVQRIYETIAEINRGGVDDPAGRAERQLRARRLQPRLRAGDRAGRAGGRLRQAAHRSRGPASLPGNMTDTARDDLRADRRQGALPAVHLAALGRGRRRGWRSARATASASGSPSACCCPSSGC